MPIPYGVTPPPTTAGDQGGRCCLCRRPYVPGPDDALWRLYGLTGPLIGTVGIVEAGTLLAFCPPCVKLIDQAVTVADFAVLVSSTPTGERGRTEIDAAAVLLDEIVKRGAVVDPARVPDFLATLE